MEETQTNIPPVPKKAGNNLFLALGIIVVVIFLIGIMLRMRSKPQTQTIPSMSAQPTTETQMSPAEMTSPAAMTEQPSPTPSTASAVVMNGVKTFAIDGGSFYFKPNVIRVKKGDKVKITFTNKGGFHDFFLDEFNVKIGPIPSNQSGEATFTADRVGTFQFYCSVGNHRKMGQVGTFIVE